MPGPVGPFRREVARDGDVVAAVHPKRQPGRPPDRGVRPVRPDHEPGLDADRAVRTVSRDDRVAPSRFDLVDGGADPLEPRCADRVPVRRTGARVEGRVQPALQRSGHDHVPEGLHAALLGPDPGEAESAPPGDVDLQDRGRLAPNLLPLAEGPVEPGRAVRQGNASRVAPPGRARIDQGDRQRPPAQGQREGRADQSAPDDRDVAAPAHVADPTMCSRSSTELGTDEDRTSTPSRVTSTTSSTRIPIPRQGVATPRSSGSM